VTTVRCAADAPGSVPPLCSWSRTTRQIDLRYLERPPATSHRPYFDFVEAVARPVLAAADGPSLLDVGCANGSFIDFVRRRNPRVASTGVDALPELIADAVRRVPTATFAEGDIRDLASMPRRCFTVVTMLTLHSHFDRLDGMLGNVMSLVAPGGRALLFGAFNTSDADVLVRIRVPGDAGWLPGWTLHSRRSVDELLAARGLGGRYHDYAPTPEWPETSKDPLRTRRGFLDGRPVFLNDAGLFLPMALLEIGR
jgi:SAM-dependent methyltransferase